MDDKIGKEDCIWTSQIKLIGKQNLSTSPAPWAFANGQTLYEGIFSVLMAKAKVFWRYLRELKLHNLNSINSLKGESCWERETLSLTMKLPFLILVWQWDWRKVPAKLGISGSQSVWKKRRDPNHAQEHSSLSFRNLGSWNTQAVKKIMLTWCELIRVTFKDLMYTPINTKKVPAYWPWCLSPTHTHVERHWSWLQSVRILFLTVVIVHSWMIIKHIFRKNPNPSQQKAKNPTKTRIYADD